MGIMTLNTTAPKLKLVKTAPKLVMPPNEKYEYDKVDTSIYFEQGGWTIMGDLKPKLTWVAARHNEHYVGRPWILFYVATCNCHNHCLPILMMHPGVNGRNSGWEQARFVIASRLTGRG